jgi:hypothetical protein
MFREEDMRHDRTSTLAVFAGNFVKARNVGIDLLLLGIADEMTIRTEARR